MILSCERLFHEPERIMEPEWLIETTPEMSVHDVLALLARSNEIPKPHGEHPDLPPPTPNPELQERRRKLLPLECCEHLAKASAEMPNHFIFTARFRERPVAVSEHSDEPHFPPYLGAVGKQPDGSCILSPRAWSHLAEAMRWLSWASVGRPESALRELKEFAKIYCEDTGTDMESYT